MPSIFVSTNLIALMLISQCIPPKFLNDAPRVCIIPDSYKGHLQSKGLWSSHWHALFGLPQRMRRQSDNVDPQAIPQVLGADRLAVLAEDGDKVWYGANNLLILFRSLRVSQSGVKVLILEGYKQMPVAVGRLLSLGVAVFVCKRGQ